MSSTPVGVKICGLTEEAGVEACVSGGADWIGFVFFARSPRCISVQRAAALAQLVPATGPERVGLFVDPSDDDVAAVLDRMKLDALQLYVSPDRGMALRTRFGLPVWLPYAVSSAADLPQETTFDRLLIESRAPESTGRPGGNGVAFDWTITHEWHSPVPWMLAGGLDPSNVAAAIKASRAPAVDVSSGVERSPGVKDPIAIARFIAEARRSRL